ncbi:Ig-like domain-containing protein [Sporolactobacillus laevolacticus]|uniref:Ig-like domain-containing protein n=1 Tax=Sporolactobacillus laevolacticus TaxID=33018 RepID=UPI0025B5BC00|nr:Ig-like domain-containing protein [Sporolactobacillus laevolacticus]MDN3954832.1 Ig-like domain-containing protein [Sporolactobacillus laevolacticus]
MEKIKRFGLILAAVAMTFLIPAGALADTQPVSTENQGLIKQSTDRILVSNESLNGDQAESSGSFSLNNDQYALSKKLNKTAYQLDYVKPFDPEKNRDNLLKNRVMKRSVQFAEKAGDSRNFWVSNLETGNYDQINATLAYSGTHANIWVNNDRISSDDAKKLGEQFDSSIYSSDVNNFGTPSDVDGNGKINIVCYDIQDGFDGSGGYVAGYFDPNDLTDGTDSNHSDILYIDTYPGMGTGSTKDVTEAYPTLAHEFQHLINFNRNVLVEGHSAMDTWIDEGLAMAAEQVYTGVPLEDEIDYYNTDSAINDGQSLLYWDYDGDTLANYALSYLFMEYLRIQCGQGNQIFKNLIDDPNSNYVAVQDLIHQYIDPNLSFGQFMTDFRLALYYNNPTGLYGFHGESGLTNIEQKIYDGSSVNLRGGGAVVMSTNSLALPDDTGSDLKYYNLNGNDGPSQIVRPASPHVNPVGNQDTSVTGTAQGSETIAVMSGTQVIGTGQTDSNGVFHVDIPVQDAGSTLNVYAIDVWGTKSAAARVTVEDRTPPTAPIPAPAPVTNPVVSFSAPLDVHQIKVTNYRNKSDKIYVKNLSPGDIINVYNSRKQLLVSGTSGGDTLTLNVKQLGTKSGKIYLTITRPSMGQSSETPVSFNGEVSGTLSRSQIQIRNYRHKRDIITVRRIKKGDYIRIYNAKKKVIAKKYAGHSSITLWFRQLGRHGGHIYVTVTHAHMRESTKRYAGFGRER